MNNLGRFIAALGELDQNNIGSWPTWAHAGALLVAAVFILGAGTWLFVMPQQDVLRQAQQREQALRQSFIEKRAQVASLDQYKAQLATMQAQFGTQLAQLPTQTEIPSLLNDISQMRLASGLTEELFRPRAAVRKDFYVILPNAMVVTGRFHQLAAFVSRITSLSRIVTVDNIQITTVDNAAPPILRMDMTINTYRYIGNDGKHLDDT